MSNEQKLPIPEQEGLQPDGTTWQRINGKMHLIPRTPDWEAKDSEDRQRYGLGLDVKSMADVLEMQLPPETAEHAYRRGYEDAWAEATRVMWELMVDERYSRIKALEACLDYAEGPLHDWRRGNCAEEEHPSDFDDWLSQQKGGA